MCQIMRRLHKLLRYGVDTALALHCFKQHSTNVAREFCLQIGNVVKADKLHIRHHRSKWLAGFFFVRRSYGAHGAAVKAMLERKKFRSEILGIAALSASMHACQLQRCFDGFCSAVAEESAIHTASFCKAHGELGLSFMKEKV